MTKLIIVRHGESEANKLGVMAGHTDYPLTSLGHKQAKETAAHLAKEEIDAVYSSDLKRAMSTAEPHATLRGFSVIPSKELREVYCGDWEDIPFTRIAECDPVRWFDGFTSDFMRFIMPNGEGILESGKRFMAELCRIAKAHEGKTVLVASHGAVIRAFWALICHTPLDVATGKHPFPSNSSYCVVEFDGEKFIPVAYSLDEHLTSVTHLHI